MVKIAAGIQNGQMPKIGAHVDAARAEYTYMSLKDLIVTAYKVKPYQVTGPVLEVTPTSITVQKGQDKWEIARNKDTKITGDLKVGAKVTIYYTMTASEVDVKAGKAKN